MRIIFLGNGPFAVPALELLATSNHELLGVVARPDRPQGKHQQIVPGPVAKFALERRLSLSQPPDVNDPAIVAELTAHRADLLVVADFGQILNPQCLAATRLGGINIHASLLPKYRGAAPIAWAIRNGESETGVSIIQMTPRLDAGGVILQQSIPIGPEQTAGEVESELSSLGATLALQAVELLDAGTATPIAQDNALATKAPRLKKEDGLIDWRQSAASIHNLVRAMIPWPVAFTFWRRKPGEPPVRLQILKTTVIEPREQPASQSPGEVIVAANDRLEIGAGDDGVIGIQQLQPAGKKGMTPAEFLRGNPLKPGDRLQANDP